MAKLEINGVTIEADGSHSSGDTILNIFQL